MDTTTLIAIIKEIGFPGALLLGLVWLLKSPVSAVATAVAESLKAITERVVKKLDQDEENVRKLAEAQDRQTTALMDLGAAAGRIGTRIDEAISTSENDRSDTHDKLDELRQIAIATRDITDKIISELAKWEARYAHQEAS